MQVPFNSSTINLHENFDLNQGYPVNREFDQLQSNRVSLVSPFNSVYQRPVGYSYPVDERECVLKSDYSMPTLPPLSVPDLSFSSPVSQLTYNPSPSLSYIPTTLSHPCSIQTCPCTISPSTSSHISADSSSDIQVSKKRTRNRVSKQNLATSPLSETDGRPISLSTKDSYSGSNDGASDCSTISSNKDTSKNATDKDDRYLQRRLKNNLAAKRSRDNRKRREDTIALRASYLEKSNLMLQTQILSLKREICLLRGIPFDPNYKPCS